MEVGGARHPPRMQIQAAAGSRAHTGARCRVGVRPGAEGALAPGRLANEGCPATPRPRHGPLAPLRDPPQPYGRVWFIPFCKTQNEARRLKARKLEELAQGHRGRAKV